MADIDSKPLHRKNKILLYSRYVLSKLSWHFSVTSVSKTWVIEYIDSNINSYIRKCLIYLFPNTKQIWWQYLLSVYQIHQCQTCSS